MNFHHGFFSLHPTDGALAENTYLSSGVPVCDNESVLVRVPYIHILHKHFSSSSRAIKAFGQNPV